MSAEENRKQLHDRNDLILRQCQIKHDLDNRRGSIEASTVLPNSVRPVAVMMAELSVIEDRLKAEVNDTGSRAD